MTTSAAQQKLCCRPGLNRVEQNHMKNSVNQILWLIVADCFVIIVFLFFAFW